MSEPNTVRTEWLMTSAMRKERSAKKTCRNSSILERVGRFLLFGLIAGISVVVVGRTLPESQLMKLTCGAAERSKCMRMRHLIS